MAKEIFIESEIWVLTIMGAFQRANIYKDRSLEKSKSKFKLMLKGFIDRVIINQYSNEVSENKHIENIYKISEYSSNFNDTLNNEKLNFGVSQKILNLYLKYLWCLGKINTPPHFPVDRIIQNILKVSKVVPWTRMDNEEDYLIIINHAKKKLQGSDYKTLAELELKELNVYLKKKYDITIRTNT